MSKIAKLIPRTSITNGNPGKSTRISYGSDSELEFLFFRLKDRFQKVLIKDIYLMESFGDYVIAYTENQKYAARCTFKKLEALLPSNEFLKVHRSYIVQLSKIDSVEINGTALTIADNHVPVSRSKKSELMKLLQVLP